VSLHDWNMYGCPHKRSQLVDEWDDGDYTHYASACVLCGMHTQKTSIRRINWRAP
jgi:hypothetical protein